MERKITSGNWILTSFADLPLSLINNNCVGANLKCRPFSMVGYILQAL
jgi:hypothetical protein